MESEKPTAAELEILTVLWERGSATVRQVHEKLAEDSDVGYTTILKQMQVMHQKKLLKRDTSERAHVYSPAVARDVVQRSALRDLADALFGGSARALAVRALSEERISREELEELKNLIDRLEGESK